MLVWVSLWLYKVFLFLSNLWHTRHSTGFVNGIFFSFFFFGLSRLWYNAIVNSSSLSTGALYSSSKSISESIISCLGKVPVNNWKPVLLSSSELLYSSKFTNSFCSKSSKSSSWSETLIFYLFYRSVILNLISSYHYCQQSHWCINPLYLNPPNLNLQIALLEYLENFCIHLWNFL